MMPSLRLRMTSLGKQVLRLLAQDDRRGRPMGWIPACAGMTVALLAALAFASIAPAATTFTATQSGDWNTPATWGLTGTATCHTNVPCSSDTTAPNGDLVIIPDNFTVTCTGNSEVCSAGDSPTLDTGDVAISVTHVSGDAGGIHVGGTATLIYAGHVNWAGGTFTVDAGGTIEYDSSWSSSSTTAAYTWSMNHTGTPTQGAQMALNGTLGSPVTWQGDSIFSARVNGGACAVNACRSGEIGVTPVDNRADQGWGTYSWVNFTNVGQASSNSIYINQSLQTASFEGVTLTNCGTPRISVGGATASGNFTIDRVQSVNTAVSNNNNGALNIGTTATTVTGVHSVTNSVFDYAVQISSGSKNAWTWRNNIFYAGAGNALPFRHPGFNGMTADLFDQNLIFNDATSDDNSLLPMQNATNNVFWTEKRPNGSHVHPFNALFSNNSGVATMAFQNNVIGSLGTSSTSDLNTTNMGVGGALASGAVMTASGNVTLCGANGQNSSNFFLLDNTNITGTGTLVESNNTFCSNNGTLASDTNDNSIGAESITIPSAFVTSINSNLFYRNDGNGAGSVAEVCDVNGTQNYTGIIAALKNNAVVNTNTGASAICTAVTTPNAWITSGPTGDTIIQNRPPVLVDLYRSLATFDIKYLGGTSSYSATTWTSGNAYVVGNVVSDAQSGIYNGLTTYWRCVAANTAASTNRPVTGTSGAVGIWEPAVLSVIKTDALAGTTYTDGAINAAGLGIVGVLNAWLRQGMTSMEPTLWNGCLSSAECGAVQLAAIRHLPPPVMVN